MWQCVRRYLASLSLLCGASAMGTSVQAAEAPEDSVLHWRGDLVAAVQASGGLSISLGLAFAPRFTISDELSAVAQLGATEFNTAIGTYFTAIDYGGLAAYKVSPSLTLEAGVGAEYWTGDGGNVNALAFNFNGLMPMWGTTGNEKRLLLGYSAVLVPAMFTSVLRLGVEI